MRGAQPYGTQRTDSDSHGARGATALLHAESRGVEPRRFTAAPAFETGCRPHGATLHCGYYAEGQGLEPRNAFALRRLSKPLHYHSATLPGVLCALGGSRTRTPVSWGTSTSSWRVCHSTTNAYRVLRTCGWDRTNDLPVMSRARSPTAPRRHVLSCSTRTRT